MHIDGLQPGVGVNDVGCTNRCLETRNNSNPKHAITQILSLLNSANILNPISLLSILILSSHIVLWYQLIYFLNVLGSKIVNFVVTLHATFLAHFTFLDIMS
jgi:hypothetical protein